MGQNWIKYGRGRTAGTGGQLGSTTPSKVWSWVPVYWTTAISKTSCNDPKWHKMAQNGIMEKMDKPWSKLAYYAIYAMDFGHRITSVTPKLDAY